MNRGVGSNNRLGSEPIAVKKIVQCLSQECAAVGALRRHRRTPEDDRFKGNWYDTDCGQYDHLRAFTVKTPRRGVSTEFMIVSKAIGIIYDLY